MLFGYFGGMWVIVWVGLVPLALFTFVLVSLALSAGLDGLATWTGSCVMRRIAAGFDFLSRGLTLLLAGAIVVVAASVVLAGMR